MKKLVCVLPLLAICMTPAFANNNDLKIKTVKNMYSSAIKANRNDEDIDTLRTLFRASDQSLQNAITLAKFGRMSDDGGAMTSCHGAYEMLTMNPSNGFSIDEVQNINYRVLKNGRVRASVNYTSEYTGIRDFSLKCSGNSCKVTDVFNFDGDSGKRSSEKLCR